MNDIFLKRLLKIGSVAVIYYISARLGLLLALGHTNASPVWPPSGFAFAAILILGFEVWPGILIGAFIANIVVFLANKAAGLNSVLPVSALIASGNTLEAIAGYYLIRWFRSEQILTRTKDFSFFILTALLMCLISCSIGTTSLVEGNIINWGNYKSVWFTWWMGDVSGIIVLTPVLLSCWNFFRKDYSFPKPLHFAAIFIVLLVYLMALFNGWLSAIPGQTSIYLVLIILIWCVFSIQQWQSSLLVILIASFSI
ncbi:MAG TPA: MASE1 domain-containing protein, partial [Bacteroidia bacterium]|nr:MASE1 domain-containing protein [Bacteroidia bacterium]